jgi:hypothetical protein
MNRKKGSRIISAIASGIIVAAALVGIAPPAHAQGVTTGLIAGVVADAQGAVVPGATVTAVHEPSGTSYEAVSRRMGVSRFPA